MDGRATNGGKLGNKGGGRKPKAQEDKALERIKAALKAVYKQTEDEPAIILFLEDFAKTKEGMKFMAEHLLGKAATNINDNFDTSPIIIMQDVSGQDIDEDDDSL